MNSSEIEVTNTPAHDLVERRPRQRRLSVQLVVLNLKVGGGCLSMECVDNVCLNRPAEQYVRSQPNYQNDLQIVL